MFSISKMLLSVCEYYSVYSIYTQEHMHIREDAHIRKAHNKYQ